MADILGVDFLTNPRITESSGDIKLPDLASIELPSFNDVETSHDAPKLVPSFQEAGPLETSDGFKNLNAGSFMSHTPRMSEEYVMKEKYEILRKFERLQKLGVPIKDGASSVLRQQRQSNRHEFGFHSSTCPNINPSRKNERKDRRPKNSHVHPDGTIIIE